MKIESPLKHFIKIGSVYNRGIYIAVLSGILFLLITALSACSDISGSSGEACCKVCDDGKPCGDTCISSSEECHEGSGCACSGGVKGVALKDIPKVRIGRCVDISGISYVSGNEKGVIGRDGRFLYEKESNLAFKVGESKISVFQKHQEPKLLNIKDISNNSKTPILLSRFLLTLDSDQDYYTEGIHIRSSLREYIENVETEGGWLKKPLAESIINKTLKIPMLGSGYAKMILRNPIMTIEGQQTGSP